VTWVSYAQNYEDVVLRRALAHVSNGFYIDAGAQHPRIDSVTRAFYELGWRGINIEPGAGWHAMLEADRPGDTNLRVCAGDRDGDVAFWEVVGSGLSTIDPGLAEAHRQSGERVVQHQVPMRRLDDIWDESAPAEVHFLKIDVEGAEESVLRGLDLRRHRPWIILVEATEPNSRRPSFAAWEPLLLAGGYRFAHADGLNRFYVADERKELEAALVLPPNFFDDFVRRDVVDERALLRGYIAELEAAVSANAAALSERDAARREQAAALATSEAARAERDHARAERDAARAERDAALARAEQLQAAVEAVRADLQSAIAVRDRLIAEQQALIEAERTARAHDADRGAQRERELLARLEAGERAAALLSRLLVDAQSAGRAAQTRLAESERLHATTAALSERREVELQRLLHSRSWRYTAPLRSAIRLMSRMRPGELARSLARVPPARRAAARVATAFPRAGMAIKQRLYGPAPSEGALPVPGALERFGLSEEAERILALHRMVDAAPERDR
jgi:FkbM family methyltransferase